MSRRVDGAAIRQRIRRSVANVSIVRLNAFKPTTAFAKQPNRFVSTKQTKPHRPRDPVIASIHKKTIRGGIVKRSMNIINQLLRQPFVTIYTQHHVILRAKQPYF